MNWWDRFLLACKAFVHALKDEKKAHEFVVGAESKCTDVQEPSHLRLLGLLQQEGRLVDFLKEDISSFTDAQIGAAVRKIHSECGKTLEEFVTLRPLFRESEGAQVTIPQGYDANAVKVIGKVKGTPPYQGILRHKGWKAHKLSLPKQLEKTDPTVVCAAEIELK